MAHSENIQLAKSGDHQAIAAVIGNSLRSKGVSVKTTLTNGCLTIVLESEEALPKNPTVEFLQKGLHQLAPQDITRIVVRNRLTKSTTDCWREGFALNAAISEIQNNAAPLVEASQGVKQGPVLSSNGNHKAKNPYLSKLHKFYEALPSRFKTRTGERVLVGSTTFILTSLLWLGLGAVAGTKSAPRVTSQAKTKQTSIPFIPKAESYSVKGSVTLVDSEIGGTASNCYGTGGFDDINASMPVTIKDSAGAIIATGETGVGSQPSDSEYSSVQCKFEFTINEIPKSNFYQIQVGRRGNLNYSFEDMTKNGWEVKLSLGT
jgi:hypothetical protein